MNAVIGCVMTCVVFVIPMGVTVGDSIAQDRQFRTKTARPHAGQVAYAQKARTHTLPVYRPPLRGAPANRVGGASRGIAEAVVTLQVLTPNHTGLTMSEQPTLYWHISTLAPAPLQFTLIDEQAIKPVAEIDLDAPGSPGFQRIDLAKHGIRLTPGVEYQWFVTLVPDPRQRSNDILAGGAIERMAPPANLIAKLDDVRQRRLPYIYADAGFWYDAIAAVSELIESDSDNARLRAARAALLQQVGLAKIAIQDKGFAAQ